MSSDKADTRTRILEATWRLLEKRCGQGVRMSDIAKEAGVSRQAVYLHFESRKELIIATTKYVDEVKSLKRVIEELCRIAESNPSQLLTLDLESLVKKTETITHKELVKILEEIGRDFGYIVKTEYYDPKRIYRYDVV